MYITFTDEYNTLGMNTGKCVCVRMCVYTHTHIHLTCAYKNLCFEDSTIMT